MLQSKKICKKYVTGSLVQEALDNVSLNLRDREFAAVLGQSGSGKTTLMNIIGGLDHNDSGDIIINNISIKKYTDRDWDSDVLVAFVAISLIVSSIMIGIITFVLVIERTKEIGILRAIGASKRNISQIFNAETLIIGLISGLLGIGLTLLFLIPVNAIIHVVLGTAAVNASLPFVSAAALILLSVILSIIAGLIPSGKAAKKDPVIALRSE